ncbi:MAG: FkbM family methyltransferase [Sphingomonadales bacterium BRH_c3]|nr:MAG: FkbM family methyltransferase [Sphingomonadales bacterium BRH_c3]
MSDVEKILKNLPYYGGIYIRELALAARLALKGRVHQYQEVRALRAFLKTFEVDCVFDVGANHGQYARMLRRDVGYKGLILSFEPAPQVFQPLMKGTEHDRDWYAFHMALSDSDGTAPFHIMAGDQCSSLNAPALEMPEPFSEINRVVETVDVQLRRLDGLFNEFADQFGFKRPYLKLDTQGHDRQVTMGAGKCLHRFLGIQTELAVRMIYEHATDYRQMIADLEVAGFVPNAFFANNRGHFPLLYELDGIFINTDLLADN